MYFWVVLRIFFFFYCVSVEDGFCGRDLIGFKFVVELGFLEEMGIFLGVGCIFVIDFIFL